MHLASEIRCKDTWHKHTLKISVYTLGDIKSLQWRHNECDGVTNHQPHDCLLKRLFRRISKETSKLRVTGLCVGNSVTRKMFPFDDVILCVGKTGHYWFRWPFRPFYLHVLTSTPSGISNHMLGKAWDEIIYPFPDIISSWQDSGCISFSKTHSRGLNQLHFAIFKSKTFVTGKPWT